VEKYLNLDALYVLGTNCVDNGPRQGLEKFLNVASADPDTVLHYEFMQVALCTAGMTVNQYGYVGALSAWRGPCWPFAILEHYTSIKLAVTT
jgi:hypothetical protein